MLSVFGRGQVIVKLGNIELTPENPEYPGGGWHLERMLNERIIATVSTTMIRKISRTVIWLSGNDSHGFLEIFGLKRDEPAVQGLDYIITKEDRVITFLNVAPQQRDWWRAELYKRGLFPKLLPEIVENILDYVDWPMTLEKAKDVRLKFMQEPRSMRYGFPSGLIGEGNSVKLQNEMYYAREFSLCKH
ncbi:hypothetical protein EV426DRAFT_570361 [Tirmania nivea]|nr:hypothetical protein EV426DRAFT_570361 [Tirmania nivea]